MHPWLARLRHDLVKRAVWPARDLRDAGAARAEDLAALRRGLLELRDGDGAPVSAGALWARLRAEAPALPAGALDAFGAALAEAERAAGGREPDPQAAVDAVLRLENAFAALARTLDEE